MYDIPVVLRITVLIIYIPAQQTKERINEIYPCLGFVIFCGLVGIGMVFKSFNQLKEFIWYSHRSFNNKEWYIIRIGLSLIPELDTRKFKISGFLMLLV